MRAAAACLYCILFALSLPAAPEPGGLVGHRDAESAALDGRIDLRGFRPGGAAGKTVASGLYMSGSFAYALSNGVATITLDRIANDSFTRTTGPLRLELWASGSAPARAEPFTGYRLVAFDILPPLPPRNYYYNISRSASYLSPPNGSFWLVLVLAEYVPIDCASADGYCEVDSFISNTRVAFGDSTQPRFNYTDMWWNPGESGWGVAFTHHPTQTAFAAWYTYSSSGFPYWYVAPDCKFVGDACTSILYETTGPPFGPTFDPAMVTPYPVGLVTFSFTSQGAGTMSYILRGTAGSKAITRQPF